MGCNRVFYEELGPTEFVERINDFPVAYLPLGTLEWHGLHLPLGSDGLQARGIFERMAIQIGGIVLPMLFLGPDSAIKQEGKIYYGMDHISFDQGEARQLEGSAYYIGDKEFDALLDIIMDNLSRAGFKVVIGHGHGPSTNAFFNRKQLFREKFNLITYNLWELGYEGKDGIQTDHAAINETSLMMALLPELVNIEKLSGNDVPVGVWGVDPRKAASANYGSEIIEKNIRTASQKLRTIVSDIPKIKHKLDYEGAKNLLR